jgi:hypothetical protein
MKPGRRNVKFASLAEVVADVEQLLAGHATVGCWSLGQILNHLALTIRMSMVGFPVKFPWIVRRLFGPVGRRLCFGLGRLPEGFRAPEASVPSPGLDAAIQAENLRTAIERFGPFPGRLVEHPLLGKLSTSQWERFHRLHCAHHLSFVGPAIQECKAALKDQRPNASSDPTP